MSLTVSDLMSTDPVTLTPEDDLAHAWDLMDHNPRAGCRVVPELGQSIGVLVGVVAHYLLVRQ